MRHISPELAASSDRLRWNERYCRDYVPSFSAHPLAEQALALARPEGPVLDLACGPSGSALLAAAAGRHVTAVDASEVALGLLAAEASRRRLDGLITLVHADLRGWRPPEQDYALVLCTGYWDRAVFAVAVGSVGAAGAVGAGGLIGWEALTQAARRDRPQLPSEWCLGPGEPAILLPDAFLVLSQQDIGAEPAGKRRLLARRRR